MILNKISQGELDDSIEIDGLAFNDWGQPDEGFLGLFHPTERRQEEELIQIIDFTYYGSKIWLTRGVFTDGEKIFFRDEYDDDGETNDDSGGTNGWYVTTSSLNEVMVQLMSLAESQEGTYKERAVEDVKSAIDIIAAL